MAAVGAMLRHLMSLPPLPRIALREIEDLSPPQKAGFLSLRRRRLTLRYPDRDGSEPDRDGSEPDRDGSEPDRGESEPFVYDSVDRRALDAVVMVAHFCGPDGQRQVYLRSAVRPPVYLRAVDQRPLPEKETLGILWELPAGLVEPSECSPAGLARCAARELFEELGFRVEPRALRPLGPANFPSAGVIGERHHFFHVEVQPEKRAIPAEDGSVLERDALVVSISLAHALAQVRDGGIEDGKTEIALRRIAEL